MKITDSNYKHGYFDGLKRALAFVGGEVGASRPAREIMLLLRQFIDKEVKDSFDDAAIRARGKGKEPHAS